MPPTWKACAKIPSKNYCRKTEVDARIQNVENEMAGLSSTVQSLGNKVNQLNSKYDNLGEQLNNLVENMTCKSTKSGKPSTH